MTLCNCCSVRRALIQGLCPRCVNDLTRFEQEVAQIEARQQAQRTSLLIDNDVSIEEFDTEPLGNLEDYIF